MQRLARFMPDMFTRLIILAVVLASLMPVTGQAAVLFGWATKLAIALLFFLHGARLSREVVIAGALHWRLHLVILGTTFVLFPIIGWCMGFIPESILPQGLYMGMLFICVLPSTVQSSIAFTSVAGGNVAAAICAASASNIFGMVLTPLLVGLMMTATGSAGFSLSILGQIFLQLLLPFLLGQLLQPWVGNWVRARKKLLAPVDRGSVLMVVYLAFSDAMAEGMWSRYSIHDILTVVVADALLLALVLAITALGGRAMGFSREDRIAILFCGSKKSMASGVPMASVIFAGQAIGPIVLPLMLFHQIQLMVCSVLAQRYADQNRRAEADAQAAARLQGA